MVNDMTAGKPLKTILRMSLPIMAGNLFQQFYSMTDTVIVGRFLGKNALAGVGSTGSLYSLILWFVTGLTGGFTILIAQSFGAGEYEKMRDRLFRSAVLAFTVTIAVMCVGLVFIRRLLVLMHTPEEIMGDACRYIIPILCGLSATMLYNLTAAVLRSLGDSRTPLYFLILTSALNIALDFLFVGVLGSGTEGAAWATVISQALSGVLCVVYMYRKFPILHIGKRNLNFEHRDMRRMLGMGLPLGLQGAITASGVIVLQFAVNSYGAGVVAAYTAATKVEQVVNQPLAAYSVTMASYVGQNYGAKRLDNIKQGVLCCGMLVVITAAAGGLILLTLGGSLAGLFLETPDVQMVSCAREYLSRSGMFLTAFGLLCMLRSSIQGMGNARIPMLNGVIESTSRILWTVWLIRRGNFHQLCFANPATWSVAAVMLVLFYRREIRKVSALFQEES